MTINAVLQNVQPSRIVMTDSRGATLVYEDRNQDGKLELFSHTIKAENLYELNTRITTHYDYDGDGLCDEKEDIVIPNQNLKEKTLVIPNVVATKGTDLGAITEKTVFNNISKKPNMEDILNPKQSKVNSSWLF